MLPFAITGHDVTEAIPVILSLIVIEGLLSVDNALAIAAMASHLPGRQKILALRLGIIGAYVFRGIALACASLIIANPWLKVLGAIYLIHLMATHFGERRRREEEEKACEAKCLAKVSERGFVATIAAIEFMDLSLSVDNVVAAVVMSPKLWVVCTGVFIGILALRLVAGFCIRLIERFPILEHTAFLLIGYVGLLLIFELTTGIEVHTLGKFIGIVTILALSILYSRIPAFVTAMRPVVWTSGTLMRGYTSVANAIFMGLTYPWRAIVRHQRNDTATNDQSTP